MENKEAIAQAEGDFYFTITSQIARLKPHFGISDGYAELEVFCWLNYAKQTYEAAANKNGFAEFFSQDKLISELWPIVDETYVADIAPHTQANGGLPPEATTDATTAASLQGMIQMIEETITGLAVSNNLLTSTCERAGLLSDHALALKKNPEKPCTACQALCTSRANEPELQLAG